MKKILSGLVLISSLTVLVVPVIVSAQQVPNSCTIRRNTGIADCPSTAGTVVYYDKCYSGGTETTCPGGVSGSICCLVHAIVTATDWIFIVMLAIVILLVIMGAITILTAGGIPDNVTKGKNYILWGVVGLIIGIFAKAIPAIVRTLLGA